MRFHVADSLTGRIVGTLTPTAWDFTDPLRGAATGSLTVPLPSDPDAVATLVDQTQPRRRWVAIEDDEGRFLFGGPIPRKPSRSEGTVTIPLVDWRSWFYRAPIRPLPNGARRNYIRTGSAAKDQGAMMADLFALALDTIGAPAIVVDKPPVTEVVRELTALMLDRSIGDILDTISNRERGAEWHTYVSRVDPTRLMVHAAVSYPERSTRPTPIKVDYQRGQGGNAHDYTWPEGEDSPTRVWAIGDGEPPDQALAVDEAPELTEGTEVCWEETLGPLSGVTRNTTAFDYAYAALERGRGLSGTAEFSIRDSAIPVGSYATGDRARVVLDDGWDSADVPAARIVSRTVSGGKGSPTQARISVDLFNSDYGGSSLDPGEVVIDDGEP